MDFTDLAYAKFLQTWPELSTLMLTFQDMSEELGDDTDVKVGIFVLRSGEDLFYVPVVAKGQGLFPIDSIFFNSKSKFFPLSKETIEDILNSQRLNLGRPAKIPSTVVQNPNLNELINPPRTGKFVYASASRLTEFLTILPNEVKSFVMEKISSDMEVLNGLDSMFGVNEVLQALIPNKTEDATRPLDQGQGIRVITNGSNLPTPQVSSILTQGYAIDGENPLTRMAIPSINWMENRFRGLSNMDGGYEYDLVMSNGGIRCGYVPARVTATLPNLKGEKGNADDGVNFNPMYLSPTFVLYGNGDFSLSTRAVIQGEMKQNKQVLKDLFERQPPCLLRDLDNRSRFALFDQNMGLIGAYSSSRVAITHDGVIVAGIDMLSGQPVMIHGFRGYNKSTQTNSANIYVPYNVLVVRLNNNVTEEMEISASAAAKKQELIQWGMLNDSLRLTYDDVEYHVNGRPVGAVPHIMEILVVKEGLQPDAAQAFVKQAQEKGSVTIYLSKRADFEPGEIPSFGINPPDQINQLGKGSNFMPNVSQAMQTQDPQTVENTLISELLQTPDMFTMINEYLPDIEECLDKLGRILFLGRINLSKLGEENNADDVFNFMSQLKNVYAMLGSNYIKLQRFSANVQQAK